MSHQLKSLFFFIVTSIVYGVRCVLNVRVRIVYADDSKVEETRTS